MASSMEATDGETIISSGGTFELGFFIPRGSINRYIGIWYKQILPHVQTVVWVANRENPLNNTSSAVLKVTRPGILALLNDKNETIWSTNTSRSVQNPVAVLLDSGNLVVKEANDNSPEDFLWQSFHFPTDTLLPDMKLGKNFKTGHEVYLSSWKNDNDPAPGEFTRNIDPTGYPQALTKSGTNVMARIGPWNGLRWSGAPIPLLECCFYQFTFNEEEVYYSFSLINSLDLTRLVLTSNGYIQHLKWVEWTKRWHTYYNLPADYCDTHSLCGAYGSCDIDDTPVCGCLEKFVARYPQQWEKGDWSEGCVRRTPLNCKKEHVFIKYSRIKLPNTKYSQYNKTMTLKGCRQVCSRNCSCTAYSSLDISNGDKGCLLWFGELVDIRKLSEGGQDIFIKMDSSEHESEAGSKTKKAKILAVIFSLLMAMILLILILLWYKRKNKKLKLKEDFELPLFPLLTITRATNNFSVNNKIGEGGFGPVYKGVLEEGEEIAVKRLSRTSMQGIDEYKNEVIYIAKLQHRNLVRLLGCCIQGEEKMLIYEYMPNNSLDSYIFDQTKNKLLDWPKRFNIINGIARGLLYLHQDSRLRIIHRDLKASNVLLDTEMNPKISDFGMARSVTGNEMGAKTRNVVGTHGYMSPEYAVDGMFSVKSDVFSFGVLVLEIVSGKKNRGFMHQDHNLNLLGHAWKLYKDDRSLELADEQLADSCNISQVLRSIQVGLLCVQQHPDDRPSMSSVVHMLANESLLPKAKEPGFFTERNIFDEGKSGSQTRSSKNEFTITMLDPRSLSTTTTDLITTNQFIIDGETIVSSSGTFEQGFFNPSGSSNRYIGIWYKQILPHMQTVVWVANREKPLTNTSSVILKVTEPGILALLNDKNEIIWSTNTSRSVQNPVAVLLDSGNLVVKDANDDNPENFLWQSFNFPTDTHLPGMKIGKNFKTGHEFYLSSWKNDNDPAPGGFTRSIDPTGYPQILTKSGTNVLYRLGPWNGLKWSGAPIPPLQQSRFYRFEFSFNEEGIYYIFSLINHSSILSRMVMTSNGDIQRFVWVDQTKRWHINYRLPADNCDTYSLCGVYGRCDIANEPICGCLDKFVPKYPQQWEKGDWTKGCVRRTHLDCNREHVFIKYPGIKLPDTKHSQNNKTMTLEGCRQVCSTDCSCTAYSSLNISNGNKGCLLWFEELVDIRKLSEGGQDIFIKMDSSEQESEVGSNRKKAKILAVSFSLLVATILLILILLWYKRKKKKLKLREDFELPLFPLSTITRATNNFSLDNKIGEGGFGPVYKGVLEEGQEIAVKRRSTTSMQGLDEYTNEVIYIAKLQHRNLVKLLGCCIQGEEKMLIYEYMPNNSLDSYIFDQTKNKLLDWPQRFHIINGIARGLLYLHQDSRLRIIHRDLKASNVLLDIEMNPKISDFGMARSVTGNEMGAKTHKVVGTHGYMSPEYAVDGMFSVKSDVFSFGVLVLEIVSGKKNRGFSHQDHNLNLLGHAWKLYKEDRSLELADEQLAYSCNISQVLRSIQVGLLCVQQHPNDRPSMFTVVQTLANESLLPKAKEPGFFTERNVYDEGKSGSQTRSSKNEVTITLLHPR
ncbi:hypothetical protein KY290_023786 [Solanum tuberosum]|uniref:Uncharacterized protein n=1 Tax=Solanum tuberosum TaxID=4113 RepID=A0ABQ7V878_SOLTU|nr:hypothetical protein KY290_023786 [Solanum tuberosum]